MAQPISTSLQIGAVFEIFSLSLLGVALPFVIISYRKTSKSSTTSLLPDARESIGGDTFHTMKAVSVGVMLGLAMVSKRFYNR